MQPLKKGILKFLLHGISNFSRADAQNLESPFLSQAYAIKDQISAFTHILHSYIVKFLAKQNCTHLSPEKWLAPPPPSRKVWAVYGPAAPNNLYFLEEKYCLTSA